MKNLEIARIFYEIADMLEFQGIEFKPVAYRRAARTIENLSGSVESVYEKGELEKLPGVGKSIAKKIEEILRTGRLRYYEKLKKQIPVRIDELGRVPELGPKSIKKLYEQLGIKNLRDLEKAARNHKIRLLEGFGEKSESEILKGIELAKKGKERMLLGLVLPIAEQIVNELKLLKGTVHVNYAGSVRRMVETIGDLDILVTSKNPKLVMDHFCGMKDVKKIIAKGSTKSSVRLRNGLQVDIRVVDDAVYGSALQYFTGSKNHSIELRKIAIKKGYKLSEYGLFKGEKLIAGKTEKDVYEKLGLQFIPPELRENRGEIDIAKKNRIPKLISYTSLRGDTQVHSKWSDGSDSIRDIALACKNMGYEYVCLTDHAKGLRIARGLNERQVYKQLKEIDKLNREFENFRIIKSIELNIGRDGKVDFPNSVLKLFDFCCAGIHYGFKGDQTQRLINAMENEFVNIIVHPTGRLLNERMPYDIDFDKVCEVAKRTGTLLEIDSFPNRLDLNDVLARKAVSEGVKITISTDSHSITQLHNYVLGIGTARRAWIQRKHVLNTLRAGEFLKKIK